LCLHGLTQLHKHNQTNDNVGLSLVYTSDVKKAIPLKAKAKAKATVTRPKPKPFRNAKAYDKK